MKIMSFFKNLSKIQVQVMHLQDLLEGIMSDMSVLNARIYGLSDEISEKTENIEELYNEISDNAERIEKVYKKVESNSKKISVDINSFKSKLEPFNTGLRNATEELKRLSDSSAQGSLEEIKRYSLLAAKSVLTPDDVALLTGHSKHYIYKLTCTNRIPHYKPHGKSIYFDRKEVEEWMKQNRVNSVDEAEQQAANYIINSCTESKSNKKPSRRVL